MPTSTDDIVGWMLKALFGTMLAIIAYFVKRIADQIGENQKELEKQGRILRRHNTIFLYLVEQAKADLDTRDGQPGRRRADNSLVALLEAITSENVEAFP